MRCFRYHPSTKISHDITAIKEGMLDTVCSERHSHNLSTWVNARAPAIKTAQSTQVSYATTTVEHGMRSGIVENIGRACDLTTGIDATGRTVIGGAISANIQGAQISHGVGAVKEGMVDCIADDGGRAHNLATVVNTTRLAIRAAQGANIDERVSGHGLRDATQHHPCRW